MPNHITNRLTIKGQNIQSVKDKIKSPDAAIDFKNIIPRPESLDIECSKGIEDAVKNTLQIAIHSNPLIGMLEKQNRSKLPSPLTFTDDDWNNFIAMLNNVRLYGHTTWYSWSIENWGTKWSAYSIEDNGDTINFETAWSMPEKVMIALSKMFPDNEFHLLYADEDAGSNTGEIVFSKGERIFENIPQSGSLEAYELAFRCCPEQRENYEFVNNTYQYKED